MGLLKSASAIFPVQTWRLPCWAIWPDMEVRTVSPLPCPSLSSTFPTVSPMPHTAGAGGNETYYPPALHLLPPGTLMLGWWQRYGLIAGSERALWHFHLTSGSGKPLPPPLAIIGLGPNSSITLDGLECSRWQTSTWRTQCPIDELRNWPPHSKPKFSVDGS